jgi:hypothetical protein
MSQSVSLTQQAEIFFFKAASRHELHIFLHPSSSVFFYFLKQVKVFVSQGVAQK